MDFRLYCVRDRVAESCGPVFQAVNDGVARRNFIQLLDKVPPHDRDAFQLWYIGTYDDLSGVVVGYESAEILDVNIPKFSDVEPRKFGFSEVFDE